MPELTQRQLKLNYWFITHKAQLKKVLIISLIVLNLGFWGYTTYGLVFYFIGRKDHQVVLKNLSRELIDWPIYHLKNKPENLFPSEIAVIPLEKGQYDLVVQVENPNLKWAIPELEYRFVWMGSPAAPDAGWQKGFFLPGEKKFLLRLNLSSPQPIRNPRIEFQNIRWKRLTKKLRNLEREKLEIKRSDFLVEDARFIRKTAIIPSKVQFKVTNKTNYNFWEVNFKILLYQGEKIVGANFVNTSRFLSGENRSLEVFWTESLPSITKIYIEPEVNVLDSDVFMKIEGGIGEPK